MTKTTELVFIPTPGMGHLLSMVEFAKLIVQTHQNIAILVIVYHIPIYEPTKIEAYITSQSGQIDPNRITFVTLPTLSNPPDPSSPDFFNVIIELNKPLVKRMVEDRGGKPSAFVLDLLNVTMIDLANELHVPSYIYFTAGANLLISMLHFQALADDLGISDITELVNDPNIELDLPGFRNRVPASVMPWVFLDKESAWPSMILNLARRFRETKGIIVNTFTELESFTLQALMDQDKVPTVYPVGPILALDNHGDYKPSNNSLSAKQDDYDAIIRWLDEQPELSVVFLCFGSMGSFNPDQVKEIAVGLDRSGYRFLWSLRKPGQVGALGLPSEHEVFEDALPEGFLDQTAHKGKIIAWAPQIAVLAHRAIGGFVSHCGWNSSLESIWFGVPMATWPIYSEQQLNAFALVKELGLAHEITLDYRWDFKTQSANYLVSANEVEMGVKKLMSMDEQMRQNLSEMSDKSNNALKEGGSSYSWLIRFIEEITTNMLP